MDSDKGFVILIVTFLLGALALFGVSMYKIDQHHKKVEATIGTVKFDPSNANHTQLFKHVIKRLDDIEKKLNER